MAIIVTELSGLDLLYVHNILHEAINQGQSVKVSQHSTTGQIMVKRGGSTWTALLGKDATDRPTCTECGNRLDRMIDADGCPNNFHSHN